MYYFLNYQKDKYGYIFLFILLLFKLPASSQEESGLSWLYQAKLKEADEYYNMLNYRKALEIYLEIEQKAGGDTTIFCKIADSYKLLNELTKAEEWYRKAIINNENLINPVYKLYFAQTLTSNGKYEEALFWFREYYKSNLSDPRASAGIRSLENIEGFYYDTTYFAVYPVTINTQYSEFSAGFFKDGILFLSDRDGGKGYLKLFYSLIEPENNLSKPVKFKTDIKTKYNEGPFSFFDDFNQVIFSQNYLATKKDNREITEVPLQLFHGSIDENNMWKDIRVLPFVNSNFSYTHPTVSDNGRILYFSSNMPGGYGKIDLYRSEYENGDWQEPVNLGESINTPGDEMFPFLFADSVLYFSSDGHGGIGGLDILKINLKEEKPEIEHIGLPLNSAYDDFGIIVNRDGLGGYLASNRSGGLGADDMYAFKIVRITFTIKIIDASTALPVSDVEILSSDEKKLGITDGEGSCTIIIPVSRNFELKIRKVNYESKIYTIEPINSSRYALTVIPIKAENRKEENIYLTDENDQLIENHENVTYKIQILASRVPASTAELKQKYKGSMPITMFYEDNWYKYSIGEFSTYTEARKNLKVSIVYDSFIIAYKDNKKINIRIAKAATKENHVPSPL